MDNDSGSERLLSFIKRRGPQRISALARAFAITPEAARQQLARLATLGLVRAVVEREGAGRPARSFTLTDRGHARFPDRHAEVSLDLIEAVRAEFGEAALDRLIARRESESVRSYALALEGAASLGERVGRLAEVRTREGYMAEANPVDGGWSLVEHHCPICTAATACQGFCRSELEIFRTVLGDDVSVERTDHLLAGARRCAYLVTMKSGDHE